MGRWGLLLVVVLLAWSRPAMAELGQARLSLVHGDVQVYTDEAGEWLPAAANMPLAEGDRLWSPKGARAEIQLRGGLYLRIGSATSLDVLALEERDMQFFLGGGHLYVNNRKGGIDHIQLDTPLASVSSYDNSLIRIDVGEDGATELGVLKGDSRVVTRRGDTLVESGSSLYIDTFLNAELSPASTPDRWERWNLKRDRLVASSGESRRYLPDELDDYSTELDANGAWRYSADYGYVWVPRVTMVGWAPYRHGRWAWIGGDYVWIGVEPWGWAPYHYGRWAFSVGIGWCWVPPSRFEVTWGPGYVGWVAGPDYVSWVPLAPREVYYGRRYYGPGTAHVGAPNVTVTNVYKNVTINNSVTVVHRDTFVSGRKVDYKPRENPFRARGASFGPPTIKPVRETRMPVVKAVAQGSRPPERVVRQDPRKERGRYQLRRVDQEHGKPVRQRTELPGERVGQQPGRVVPAGVAPPANGQAKGKEKGKDREREPGKGRPASVQTEQGVEVLRGSGQEPTRPAGVSPRDGSDERPAKGKGREPAPGQTTDRPAAEGRPAKVERPAPPAERQRPAAVAPRERGDLPVTRRPTPRRVDGDAAVGQPAARQGRGAQPKAPAARPAAEKGGGTDKAGKGDKGDKGGKPGKE